GGAAMQTTRLVSFSDAVMAIILTIMVLELKVPEGVTPDALLPVLPVFLSYVLSFVYIGIYWNNHHYLLHFCRRVTGSVLWANLDLRVWLSLLPFVTGWMGQNHFAALPTAVYGAVLVAAALAYLVLQQAIIAAQGADTTLKTALGADWKGKVSLVLYLVGIASTFYHAWIGQLLYATGAVLWVVPDTRLGRSAARDGGQGTRVH